MAEEPRKKITIKLRKPGAPGAAAAPAAPAASAAAPAPAAPATPPPAPAPAPAAEVAPAPAPAAPAEPPAAPVEMTPITESAPMTPIAEKPAAPAAEAPAPAAPKITLKKAVPAAPAPEAPAATPDGMAASSQQAKRQTSRIELPPEITGQALKPESDAVTIKLKPISQTATPETSETPEAAQAKKSKTARIELDSVLGNIQSNAPLSNTTQKTIKLQRHPKAAPAGKPTTSAPMAPVASEGGDTARTIKLARPGGAKPALGLQKNKPLSLSKSAPASAAAEPELEQLESLDDDALGPITPMAAAPAEESTGAKIFTIIGVAAAVVSIILTVVVCMILQKHGASPNGAPATGNTLHALPFERIM